MFTDRTVRCVEDLKAIQHIAIVVCDENDSKRMITEFIHDIVRYAQRPGNRLKSAQQAIEFAKTTR